MAIQKSLELESGIILPEAYIRIDTFNYISRVNENSRVELSILVYKDLLSRQMNKPEVITLTQVCTGDDFNTYFDLTVLEQPGVNILSQAYNWLKTLDFFKDAIDVIGNKE